MFKYKELLQLCRCACPPGSQKRHLPACGESLLLVGRMVKGLFVGSAGTLTGMSSFGHIQGADGGRKLCGAATPNIGMHRTSRAQLRTEEPILTIWIRHRSLVFFIEFFAFKLIDSLTKLLFILRGTLMLPTAARL